MKLHNLATAVLLLSPFAAAQNGAEHWVATWAASPQQARGPIGGRGGAPGGRGGAAPQAPAFSGSFNNQTARMIVRTSIGGRRIRVQLSNGFGAAPLAVGAAHVALRDKGSEIVAGSDHALTFSGKSSFTIPVGAVAESDPVDLNVPPLADLAISVFFPGDTGSATTHGTGLHTTYISKPGDFTAAASIDDPAATTRAWYVISSVDVLAPADTGLVVAFGDSITDGATSTPDTDSSWPSQLARRLRGNPDTANLAIVNQGISGNRVLRDGAGINALARFDKDVLSQPGVKYLMVLEGINDIGQGARANATDPVTTDELIAAMKQLIERAHMHGIQVIGCTLTPYGGAGYYSDNGEMIREAYNNWIRTGGAFDAVVDFDKATQDPENPKQIRPSFNIMDHLHPNDAGYKAMADAVDLSIFSRKPVSSAAARR